jgi:hypothetical protein
MPSDDVLLSRIASLSARASSAGQE